MNFKNNTLYSELEKAVYNQWDPIGVSNCADSVGEYDAYIPALYSFLKSNPTAEEIFKYLWFIETQTMGLQGDEQSTLAFSKLLKSLRQNSQK